MGLSVIAFSTTALLDRFRWRKKKRKLLLTKANTSTSLLLTLKCCFENFSIGLILLSFTFFALVSKHMGNNYLPTWLSCWKSMPFMLVVSCDFKSWLFINVFLSNKLRSFAELQNTVNNEKKMKTNRRELKRFIWVDMSWVLLWLILITNYIPHQLLWPCFFQLLRTGRLTQHLCLKDSVVFPHCLQNSLFGVAHVVPRLVLS